MAQSLPANHIEAQIGDVSGGSQVAIGSYIVQIGRIEGGVVNILNGPPTSPRSRPQPVLLLPRAFPGILDRVTESSNAIQALQSKESVECSGEPGSGKTSLIRHLAYQSLVSGFTAGVVYFQVNQQSNDDLLKSLFDAFYEYDSPVKPTETEIRHYLQALSALILLDDVEATSEQIESLMNIAPHCTFIAATAKRRLFGETREVTLKGLPTAEAVDLFQREFGRALSAEEQKGAQYLCESVDCIPQRVLRAAHEAREENRSLLEIVPQAKSPFLDQTLAVAEVKPRSEDQKKVLAALAVFYGAPVAAQHVAAVAGVFGVSEMLDDFEKRGLVQSHEKRYTLASDVNNALLGDLQPWLTRALAHFVDWTEEHRSQPEVIAESAQPILLILQWAVAAKHWREAKRLGHATEEALALSGKWDMWATALQSILKAAQGLQDRPNEAWALHQIGTRALCLGSRSAALTSLNAALALRESLNDQSGVAVTRHNLNILLAPPPPPSEPDDSSGRGVGAGAAAIPVALKVGVLVLLALVVALLVWWLWPRKPPVTTARIVSFTVDPATVPANGQAKLCYEVEDAGYVLIEPNIGEKKPASKECLPVTAEQTTTYTLKAFGSDAKEITQQVTLNVETAPPMAQIDRFEVLRENGPGGESDVQFRLCYEVRNAAHAEIDNNGGEVVLDQNHCQQISPEGIITYTLSATGLDGRTVTRQATADGTKPPSRPPQVLSFEALPGSIMRGEKAELCFHLKDASSVQIDPGVPNVEAGTEKRCVSVAPIKTTTYTLTALNSEGKASLKQATIRVRIPAPQIVSFTPQPNSLKDEGTVQLCYEVLYAGSLQIDHGIGEVRPNKGCVDAKVAETTTFTLTATGDGGVEKGQARITVTHSSLEVEFTAEPQTITAPNAASLCYSVSQPATITIDHGGGRFRALSPGKRDCVKVQPRQTTTYTLTAVGSSNRKESRQVTVTVKESRQEPKHARILFFEVTPTRIKSGERVQVCYGVADAIRAGIAPLRREIALVEKECINDSPEKSRGYVLSAVGEDQQAERRTVNVIVDEPQQPKHARIIDFNPSETRIKAGASVRLCYVIADAQHASLAPISREVPAEKDCISDSPKRSTRYVLRAVGEDQQAVSRAVTVEVEEPDRPPPVRITRLEIKRTILRGMQICYAVENAVSANIDPEFGAVKLPADCRTIKSTDPKTFTLLARDANGNSDQRSVNYTPREQPQETPIRIKSFTPATQVINLGARAKICYSTDGNGTAEISPEPGTVSPSILGIQRCVNVSPKESTVYTLTVTDPQGQKDSRRVTVRVQKPGIVIQ